jgi:hypothetical protein
LAHSTIPPYQVLNFIIKTWDKIWNFTV